MKHLLFILFFIGCYVLTGLSQRSVLEPIFEVEADRAGVFGEERARRKGQVHTESAWRQHVSSKYAHGPTQFTKPTWRDISPYTSPSCKGVSIFDAPCSFRAQLVYMKRLERANRRMSSWEDVMKAAEAGYNGGQGWINREYRRCAKLPNCNPRRWDDHLEKVCIRAAWACKENREYPHRISRFAKRYRKDS